MPKPMPMKKNEFRFDWVFMKPFAIIGKRSHSKARVLKKTISTSGQNLPITWFEIII